MKCVGVVRYKRPHWTYIGRYDGGCGVKCSCNPDVTRSLWVRVECLGDLAA